MDSNTPNHPYDYTSAGFSPFLTRSIDDQGGITLDTVGDLAINTTQELNYDRSQTSGSQGSSMQIGNIVIDGVNGRISVFDDNQNEVVRIGNLS